MTLEAKARRQIDTSLCLRGWTVQDKSQMNLHAAKGVALREVSFKSGEPDYTLFVGGKAIFCKEDSHAEDIVQVCVLLSGRI